MQFGAYLTGAFGQSEALYRARNEHKRGRGSVEVVDECIRKDSAEIIKCQQAAGFDVIADPQFRLYYLFQPFAEQVVLAGPQENWFNNNLFYWRPQILKGFEKQPGFTRKYLSDPLPPDAVVSLPSPYTLLMLSDVHGYADKRTALLDLCEILSLEALDLLATGAKRIQFDEPVFAYKASLGEVALEDLSLLKESTEAMSDVPFTLHTYFGNVAPFLPFLLSLPIRSLGIDAVETPIEEICKHHFGNKELVLGVLDARTSRLERPLDVVEKVVQVASSCQPSALQVTPNTGTEYIGWTHGLKKLMVLGVTKAVLNGMREFHD